MNIFYNAYKFCDADIKCTMCLFVISPHLTDGKFVLVMCIDDCYSLIFTIAIICYC